MPYCWLFHATPLGNASLFHHCLWNQLRRKMNQEQALEYLNAAKRRGWSSTSFKRGRSTRSKRWRRSMPTSKPVRKVVWRRWNLGLLCKETIPWCSFYLQLAARRDTRGSQKPFRPTRALVFHMPESAWQCETHVGCALVEFGTIRASQRHHQRH